MRALVVDDSSTIRQIIRQVLEAEFGATVAEAEGTGEALAQPGPFDLVITDLIMPGRDGLDLVRELRARPGGEHTPILVVSVEVEPGVARQAVEAGATAFVGKPFRLREITGAVREALGAPGRAPKISGTPPRTGR